MSEITEQKIIHDLAMAMAKLAMGNTPCRDKINTAKRSRDHLEAYMVARKAITEDLLTKYADVFHPSK